VLLKSDLYKGTKQTLMSVILACGAVSLMTACSVRCTMKDFPFTFDTVQVAEAKLSQDADRL